MLNPVVGKFTVGFKRLKCSFYTHFAAPWTALLGGGRTSRSSAHSRPWNTDSANYSPSVRQRL